MYNDSRIGDRVYPKGDLNMKLFAFSVRPYDELPCFLKLQKELGFEFDYTSDYPTLENLSLAAGYDAVSIITNPTSAEMLDKYAEMGVKCISTRSIGYDHIDVARAKELGIRVGHVVYSPETVADYTIMLMLMACRKAVKVLKGAERADYDLEGKMGREISQCTIGIVGTGKIGATVARHLSGFGCKLLAYDPYENDSLRSLVEYTDLERLYRESDIVTLHVPGMASNYHMIDDEAIDKMKDGAILINAARGTLVDTAALLAGIRSGKLSFACVDTFESEIGMCYKDLSGTELNRPDFDALVAEENIILSPHMAFYTDCAVGDMVGNSVRGLMAMADGKETFLEVDYK